MAEHPIKTRLKELRERLGQEEVRIRELKNEVEEIILLAQDNGDGTLTMTLHIPEIFGEEKAVIVAAMSLTDMMVSLLPDVDTNTDAYKNFEAKSVYIPDDPED